MILPSISISSTLSKCVKLTYRGKLAEMDMVSFTVVSEGKLMLLIVSVIQHASNSCKVPSNRALELCVGGS